MVYDPQKHHRRSVRLKGYDCTQPGAYFVTLMERDRECLFGEIVDREIQLKKFGRIVEYYSRQIPRFFPAPDWMCTKLCRITCTGLL